MKCQIFAFMPHKAGCFRLIILSNILRPSNHQVKAIKIMMLPVAEINVGRYCTSQGRRVQ